MALVSAATRLLFVNGQTTEQTILAACRLARRFGHDCSVLVQWDGLEIRRSSGSTIENDTVSVAPPGRQHAESLGRERRHRRFM